MHLGRWEGLITIPVGGAELSATNSGGGPSTVTVPAANYYWTGNATIASFITTLQTQLNASRPSGWTVTLSTGASGTGKVTINCSQTPWSISWTSTSLRDLLGFTSNISAVSAAQTGTVQALGLWFPDCPLNLPGHPSTAPKVTDLITTTSPTGDKLGLISNTMRRHRGLSYSHVPVARYRELVSGNNSSWERFLDDTQFGAGSPFFSVSSKVQIFYGDGGSEVLVGIDAAVGNGVTGWYFTAESTEAQQSVAGWTGMWRISIPDLTTSG